MDTSEILKLLSRVRREGTGWKSLCPAHEDRDPSLSIGTAADGSTLVHCHAGCPTEAVVAAIRLTLADLFPTTERPKERGRSVAATYDYRSPTGVLLYQVVRFSPKGFAQRRPVGDGWAWDLGGAERVLYRLPGLLEAPDTDVLVVEGEKDVDRLRGLGFVTTTNPGGAGKWQPEYGEALRGRRVFILPDNDDPGRKHAELVAASLAGIAAAVSIIELPGLRPKGDVSKWLDAGGSAEELLALIDTVNHAADGEDQVALAEAQPTELPTMTLAETLGATVAHLTRFVHFARPEHADAVALWTAHTHAALERLGQSPILALTSAVKQSGKTRVLDVLEFLVRTPWRITRPSESVLFRKIDKDHPTVLLDEIDAIFGDKTGNTEGIRSLFNSGNRRGTKVPRNVAQGKTFALVEFDVFCPKATAGIGGLPDTILDRAIVIEMERRTRGERVERLRERTARALGTPLRDGLADHMAASRTSRLSTRPCRPSSTTGPKTAGSRWSRSPMRPVATGRLVPDALPSPSSAPARSPTTTSGCAFWSTAERSLRGGSRISSRPPTSGTLSSPWISPRGPTSAAERSRPTTWASSSEPSTSSRSAAALRAPATRSTVTSGPTFGMPGSGTSPYHRETAQAAQAARRTASSHVQRPGLCRMCRMCRMLDR